MELDKILIGNRIKSERNNLKLTQEELAIKLGLNNKSSVSQYESGDAIPSDDIKLLMTKIFNCSLDYLLGKSDIRNPENITIDIDEADVAFASGFKGLNETNKMIIKNTLEALLAKQEKDDEKGDK